VRRVKQLRKLRITLKRRLSRLEKRLMSVTSTSNDQDRDMTVAYVAIEALNAWALFSRSFYLSCAIGAKTERGNRIKSNAPTNDPLGLAITKFRKSATPNTAGVWHRRDEPAWHDPNVLMTVCATLGCSIQDEIQASFSLQQNVFNDLPVLRNFFAHRNEGTSQAARYLAPRYTLPSTLSPSELLLAVSQGAATSIMLAWLDEMNITAELMCEA
jgi:hypothetical protein